MKGSHQKSVATCSLAGDKERSVGFPPSTVGDALREAAEVLAGAGVENPRLDAEAILAHCLETEPWRLRLSRERDLTPGEASGFRLLLELRRARRPPAYILGWAGFHDLVLASDPRALIPRPETELLVEKTLEFLEGKSRPEVIEIGCGSGAVALALARQLPGAGIGASDISPSALELARENAARLGLADRIDFREGDLFTPWTGLRGRGADLIVSNPPYLTREELAAAPPEVRDFEPREALDGGEDGLAVIRRLVGEAPDYLRPTGRLLIEIGAGQGETARNLAGKIGGWEYFQLVRDYCGRDRVAVFGRRDGCNTLAFSKTRCGTLSGCLRDIYITPNNPGLRPGL